MDAVVAILAGGASSRMGQPKAVLPLAGRSLIGWALSAAKDGGLEAVVVAKRGSELPEVEAEVIFEPDEPRHPLLGIVAALRAQAGGDGSRAIVALGCDMPFVEGKILAWLGSFEEHLVVCEQGGRLQPLLGRYDASVLDELEAGLERGDSLRATVAALDPRIIGEADLERFGDPAKICFNVNNEEDLAEAERIMATLART